MTDPSLPRFLLRKQCISPTLAFLSSVDRAKPRQTFHAKHSADEIRSPLLPVVQPQRICHQHSSTLIPPYPLFSISRTSFLPVIILLMLLMQWPRPSPSSACDAAFARLDAFVADSTLTTHQKMLLDAVMTNAECSFVAPDAVHSLLHTTHCLQPLCLKFKVWPM